MGVVKQTGRIKDGCDCGPTVGIWIRRGTVEAEIVVDRFTGVVSIKPDKNTVHFTDEHAYCFKCGAECEVE